MAQIVRRKVRTFIPFEGRGFKPRRRAGNQTAVDIHVSFIGG